MDAKIIKNETEYEAVLTRIDKLMDAEPDSPEENELELLTLLVEKYEEEHFPIDLPDPVEAIKFRMEQEGLSREELKAYIGSQSKVSEVLNRKRPLSLPMIRALHEGLGIPAEVLLREPGVSLDQIPPSWRNLPFNDLFKRGYFPGFAGTLPDARRNADDLLSELFSVLVNEEGSLVYCRKGKEDIQENALRAWQARAIHMSRQQELPHFSRANLTPDFFREIAQLSYYSHGPLMAAELLQKNGIHFVVLSHLPKTYLDGACFLTLDGHPLIGLTLRHDRLDNFWFTLVHELAHLYLHLDDTQSAFFDDTDTPSEDISSPEERAANKFTRDQLILPEIWAEVSGELLTTHDSQMVIDVANRIKIHPAIIAGRIRWETRDFRRFPSLIVPGKVRSQFPVYN